MRRFSIWILSILFLFQTSLMAYSSNPKEFVNELVNEVEKRIADIKVKKSLKVAILGCVVNGPGEASDADIGIAGGRGKGQIYKNGRIYKSCKESEIVDILVDEIKNSNQ